MAKDEWYVDGAHDDSYLRDIPGDGKRELARSAHRRETMHDPAHDYAYDPGHATPLIGEQGITSAVAEAQEYIKETDFPVRVLQDKALTERQERRARPQQEQVSPAPGTDVATHVNQYQHLKDLEDYGKR